MCCTLVALALHSRGARCRDDVFIRWGLAAEPHSSGDDLLARSVCFSTPTITRGLANMAHFLRGKQAGIQNDLSAGLGPEVFILDDVSFSPYDI